LGALAALMGWLRWVGVGSDWGLGGWGWVGREREKKEGYPQIFTDLFETAKESQP